MGLRLTIKGEDVSRKLWEDALKLERASFREGSRGSALMVEPPGLPGVKIQVCQGGSVVINTPSLESYLEAYVWVLKNLSIWRGSDHGVEIIKVRQQGSRAAQDPVKLFTQPNSYTLQEWRIDPKNPLQPRHVKSIMWCIVPVRASTMREQKGFFEG